MALVLWLRKGEADEPQRRHLSESAQFMLFREAGWSAGQAISHLARDAWKTASDMPSAAPIMFVIAVLVAALLPLSGGPSLWASDQDASTFLAVLWQVMAGTLGIVVAAVLFLYEAYGSSIRGRYGITLTEYSSASGVTRLIGWLTASLILTGAVLLGWGDGSPRGWAGFLTLAVATRALIAFPSAFKSVANLVGSSNVHDLRRRFLKPRVAEAIRTDLLSLRMRSFLDARLGDLGINSSPWLDRSKPPAMLAGTSGFVRDVDLNQLAKLAEHKADIQVSIPLFRRVRKSTPIAISTNESGEHTKLDGTEPLLLSSAIPRSTKYGEFTFLKELHLDSLRAIREFDEGQIESNLSIDEELVQVILAYESHLKSRGMMSIVHNTDIIETVRRYLHVEFLESRKLGADAISRAIAWSPISLMSVAAEEGNAHVAAQFLELAGWLALAEVSNQ